MTPAAAVSREFKEDDELPLLVIVLLSMLLFAGPPVLFLALTEQLKQERPGSTQGVVEGYIENRSQGSRPFLHQNR